MKNNTANASPQTELAIQQVLQAERDAERAIQDCEQDARQIIQEAQRRAQNIKSRTDQRITNMEMRHGHQLDRTIKSIEREGGVELRLEAGQRYDADTLRTVIESLAMELCQARTSAED